MKNIIYILFFLLIGCGNSTPKVTPERLPNAVIGYPYSELVQIINGGVNPKSLSIKIKPENSGLAWKQKVSYQKIGEEIQKDDDFTQITIYGTPMKKDIIKIYIGGSGFGTMYPGKLFRKIYEIDVE